MKKLTILLSLFALALYTTGCGNKSQTTETKQETPAAAKRIVSLNGSITEVLCELGMTDNIAGVDVTSTYPAAVLEKPKVGHNRNMSAEAIIGLKPDMVLGVASKLNPDLIAQLKAANVKVILFNHDYTVDGAHKLINDVADSLGVKDKAAAIAGKIDTDLAKKMIPAKTPSVLFIYARGAGTMMVSGEGTEADKMIVLAGGKNAMSGFEEFKPLTAEALVAANPDVILMFDSGLASLGGMDGLLKVPGVAQTNAGKNKQVIEMDGLLMTGFSVRTGEAISTLSKNLADVIIP